MKLKSLKKQENNQKDCLFNEKTTKIAAAFMQNKSNFKSIKIGASSFHTSKYEILTAGSGEKTNPIKPNTNPIPSKDKMSLNNAITMNYEIFSAGGLKKQTQNKPKTNPNKANLTAQ